MRELIKRFTILVLFWGSFTRPAFLKAEEIPPLPKAAPTRKPITMKYETTEGVQYRYSGKKLTGGNDLEPILFPLNDSEATGLLKKSENDETVGAISLVVGSSMFVGGVAIGASSYSSSNNTSVSAGPLILLLAGAVVDYFAIFKLADSLGEKFNAVQRYNQLVRGEPDMSFNLQPGQAKPQLQLTWKF